MFWKAFGGHCDVGDAAIENNTTIWYFWYINPYKGSNNRIQTFHGNDLTVFKQKSMSCFYFFHGGFKKRKEDIFSFQCLVWSCTCSTVCRHGKLDAAQNQNPNSQFWVVFYFFCSGFVTLGVSKSFTNPLKHFLLCNSGGLFIKKKQKKQNKQNKQNNKK